MPADVVTIEDVGHVALFGPYEKDRPGHRHRSVDLGRVHDSGNLVAHSDEVNVSCGERIAELALRLVWQRNDVGAGRVLDLSLANSSAHEEQDQARLVAYSSCGLQHSRYGIRGAMVPAVHHHDFPVEAMLLSKWVVGVLDN